MTTMPPGARVVVEAPARPNGPGVVVRADEHTVTVQMDADGRAYLFGCNAVKLAKEPR